MKLTDEELRVVKELKGWLGRNPELHYGELIAIIDRLSAQAPTRLLTEGQDEVGEIQKRVRGLNMHGPRHVSEFEMDEIFAVMNDLLRILNSQVPQATTDLAAWIKGKRMVKDPIGPLYQAGWNACIEYLAGAAGEVPQAPVVDEHRLRSRLHAALRDMGRSRTRDAIVDACSRAILSGLLHPAPTQDEMRTALERIIAEPYGCPFCDSGKLRNPDKPHDENCGFDLARKALSNKQES